jgi:hypothetical protein
MTNYIKLESINFDTENNQAVIIGSGLDVNYSWESGGAMGGEYENTYRGTVNFNGSTYHLYRHWSVCGAFSLFSDQELTNEVGSFDFTREEAELFLQN